MDAVGICLAIFYVAMVLVVLCIPIALTTLWIVFMVRFMRRSSTQDPQNAASGKAEDPRPGPAVISPLAPVRSAKSIGSYFNYFDHQSRQGADGAHTGMKIVAVLVSILFGLFLLLLLALIIYIVVMVVMLLPQAMI